MQELFAWRFLEHEWFEQLYALPSGQILEFEWLSVMHNVSNRTLLETSWTECAIVVLWDSSRMMWESRAARSVRFALTAMCWVLSRAKSVLLDALVSRVTLLPVLRALSAHTTTCSTRFRVFLVVREP